MCEVLEAAYFDVMHHLKVEVVCRALQDKRRAHVGCGVMEVKDNIVGIRASFRSKDLVDFLGSLNFIWQLVSSWHAVESVSVSCLIVSLE